MAKPSGKSSKQKEARDRFEASPGGAELRKMRGESDPNQEDVEINPASPKGGGKDSKGKTVDSPNTIKDLAGLCDHFGADSADDLNHRIYRDTSCGASISLYYADGFALHNGDSGATRRTEDGQEEGSGISWSSPGNPTGFTIQTIVEGSDAEVNSDLFEFPVNAEYVDNWVTEMKAEATALWNEANSSPMTMKIGLPAGMDAGVMSKDVDEAIYGLSDEGETYIALVSMSAYTTKDGWFLEAALRSTESPEEVLASIKKAVRTALGAKAVKGVVFHKPKYDDENED